MRTRLAIASTALVCADLPLRYANLLHRTLLRVVNAHGRLVFSDDADVDEFLKAIKSEPTLPPDSRKAWGETLASLYHQKRITVRRDEPNVRAVAHVAALEELVSEWALHADVAVIAEAACDVLGVPEVGIRSDPDAAPEIATAVAVEETRAIRRLQALLANPRAPRGSDREALWHEVFEPLAEGSTSAVVLDHYLFGRAWDLSARDFLTRQRAEHVTWLLRRLDTAMAPGATVRLIGECPRRHPRADAAGTAQLLKAMWQPPTSGRLGNVEAVVTEQDLVSRFPHDRHIRFSSGAAVTITAGFDRLRDEQLWDRDGTAWSYAWHPDALADLAGAEERALTHSASTHAVVLRREATSRGPAAA